MRDFALQNMFTDFCSTLILLLLFQVKLSVTRTGFREIEKNCALVTTTKKNKKQRTCHGVHLPLVQKREATKTRIGVTVLSRPQYLFWCCSSDGTLIWCSVSNHYL